ncbi:Disease resistance protein, partial [Thalictrum thalictroides]
TELLRIIPRGMMRNFSNLEILALQVPILSGDFDEEMHGNIINELQCLKQLKYLDITISDFKDLEKFVSDPCLCNCTRVLRVRGCKEITLRLSVGHFKQLRDLIISNCSKLQELFFNWITNNDEKEVRLFENLEKMHFLNLPKLVISWDVRNLQCEHFRKLRFVYLEECDAIVEITWLLLVPNLQLLWIEDCGGLEEIISSSEEFGVAYDKNTFSNLKTFVLKGLPNLQSICGMNALPFPSLETIHVRRCPKLRRLPVDSNSAKNTLKKIKGEEEWWEGLEWENETIKARFIQMYEC